ncbi:MAG: cobalamin biosynthesis protein P47K [Planctomycetes bacterium]|nr:cobalamin biosynthesis protein P47K [Planctomycetota bacterium]
MDGAASGAASGAKRVRFHVVGGFLGAGKTTALLRLAAQFQADGLRVGLITNDQAANLVDTGAARAGGFRVEEVAGACFCCKFDDLARLAEKLRVEERPDVLIGEPVGSCTDLAATVVKPLERLYGQHYTLAPYSVLVDPTRARQLVLQRGFGGFSAKVAYLFLKQLEEADLIGLNKVDLLAPAERDELQAALAREFPKARVLPLSGLTGEGFADWRALLSEATPAGANIAAVDYDLYAEAEAELGWLNLAFAVAAPRPFDAEALVRDAVAALARELATLCRGEEGEVAHAKILFEADGATVIANHVGGGSAVRVSRPGPLRASRGRLIVNARVHLAPERLRAAADRALAQLFAPLAATATLLDAAQFRPGRPVPIHRDRSTSG